MTIRDFQYVQSLNTGSTTYVQDLAKYFKLDTSKPPVELNKELQSILQIDKQDVIDNLITINGRFYGVAKELLNEQSEQFFILETLLAEDDNINNLHKLLALYVRPTFKERIRKFPKKVYQYVIVPFHPDKHNDTANELLDMEIGLAIGCLLFFYQNAAKSIMRSINTFYLNQMKQIMEI